MENITTETKPRIEWLQMLPEPYQSEAIKEAQKCLSIDLDCSFESVLEGAFWWRNTENGERYWNDLDDRWLSGEFLPKQGWVLLSERLPDLPENVWLFNEATGYVALGCVAKMENDYCVALSKGSRVYSENGHIVTECEETELIFTHWHALPKLPKKI